MHERFFWESWYRDPLNSVVFFSRKFSLFSRGDRVVVGVSGGRDSIFLLYVLSQHRSKFGISEVVAAHFNHMTRGRESERDEEFVLNFSEKLGVKCISGRAERSLKGENDMRKERYRFLLDVARKEGACKVTTAHTLDDQFETFLINLVRGKGFFSMIGVMPKLSMEGIQVVRPMLSVRRASISDFLRKRGIPYVEDSSNFDLSYLRNRIRAFLELLPDELYSSLLKGFFRLWLSSYDVIELIGKIYDSSPENLPDFLKVQIELFREKGDYSFEEVKSRLMKKKR